jgi:NAD(P)-dependent dehydrogenase (short-subunit alcohol dehydrogenase family)
LHEKVSFPHDWTVLDPRRPFDTLSPAHRLLDSTRGLPNSGDFFQAVNQRRMMAGRGLTTRDVADSVLFLASSLSDLVQGATLVVDGGEGIAV